jgi:hypothetical protein
MRHQVCTVSPALARVRAIAEELAPFLPAAPDPNSVTTPKTCACGADLTMEMEKDLGECVDCGYKAAMAAFRGKP